MKKTFAVLTALLPLIYAGAMQTMAMGNAEDEVLFAVLGVFLLIGFLFPLLFMIASAKAESKFLAICNLWFYAGNLLLFAAEAVLWLIRLNEVRIAEQNGAVEGGLGLALLIVIYLPHWISYLWVRVFGAIGTSRALTGKCSNLCRACHMLLQLVPLTDLVSAIWVLGKVKACQGCQQPPIEMQ